MKRLRSFSPEPTLRDAPLFRCRLSLEIASWLVSARALINRDLSAEVAASLADYIELRRSCRSTSHQWSAFYRFVADAYSAGRFRRPAVSQLFFLLREQGISEAAKLAVVYAHCLQSIAVFDVPLEEFVP